MFSIQNYKSLLRSSDSIQPHVSIYVPAHRAGNKQEDRLKYKNALSMAVNQLCDEDMFPDTAMNKKSAYTYLAPALALLEQGDFWSRLSDGLVVFLHDKTFEYYSVPISFNNFVFVGNQFYLRHLLPLVDKNNKFFILALSQNEVRFFEARKHSITPVVIEDFVPNGIKEMIGVDDTEQVLQMHNSGNAIFHGQGGGKDDKNKQLYKYFQDVDEGLMKMLYDETAPMVIYAVDYEIPMYKEISRYSNLAAQHVTGNPEHEDPMLIHERAWDAVRDTFEKNNATQKEIFQQAMAEDKASFSTHHIIPAAFNGKVKTLFVDANTDEIWGTYDKNTNILNLHTERQPNSLCLLNEAALATFNNGGIVHNIPRTGFPMMVSQVNAVYRF
jgi:hypothetical protein